MVYQTRIISFFGLSASHETQKKIRITVFHRILLRAREKVCKRQYVMTQHARKEMNEDGLTIYDIERGILLGEIVERQKDRVTAEWKYCIVGETIASDEIKIVVKFSPTGKLVIITVFLL
jgi:hypothetical protein